ncbi:hypothetical protein PPERSA_05638 [Pseudocohnilembus persalinus]|uniref:Uncharacterized protein n=1 Tax=Pseudocohnilembus persalinus TaxID=266149 RepID=A0A0V0QQ53_PSEPJ|nr:hypothetical protein PPERSA_05638 [Pseudocohnilembus persalinus]|eukprot:KRX04377.1 hypothetical protein PPERSA_05638 [Pseudocohnilembus persalinus]
MKENKQKFLQNNLQNHVIALHQCCEYFSVIPNKQIVQQQNFFKNAKQQLIQMEKTLQTIKKALKTNQKINGQKLQIIQDENQLTNNSEQKQQDEDELKKQLQNGQELQQMKEQDDSYQQNKNKNQIQEQIQKQVKEHEKDKSQQNQKKEKEEEKEEEQDSEIYQEKYVQIINTQSKFSELYDENEAAIKFYSFASIAYYGLVKSYNFCIKNYDLEFWQKILSYYHTKIVDEQNVQCMKARNLWPIIRHAALIIQKQLYDIINGKKSICRLFYRKLKQGNQIIRGKTIKA